MCRTQIPAYLRTGIFITAMTGLLHGLCVWVENFDKLHHVSVVLPY